MTSEEIQKNLIENRIEKLGDLRQSGQLADIWLEILSELIQMRIELSATTEAVNGLTTHIRAAAAPGLRCATSSNAGGRLRTVAPLEFVPIGSGASQFD
jgi:hypothetical protein